MQINTKKIPFGGVAGFAIGFLFAFGLFSFQSANDLKAQLSSYHNVSGADVVLVSDDPDKASTDSPKIHHLSREEMKSVARYIWKKCKSDNSSDETTEQCMQRHFDVIKKQQKKEEPKPGVPENGWNSYSSKESEQKHEAMKKEAEKKQEEQNKKAEEKKKIYLHCRENSEFIEELQDCIRKKLEASANEKSETQILPKKSLPQNQKRDLKELVQECLKTEPQNLRECIKSVLESQSGNSAGAAKNDSSSIYNQPKEKKSTPSSPNGEVPSEKMHNHHYQGEYLPGQLPPVQSDDITNPTI